MFEKSPEVKTFHFAAFQLSESHKHPIHFIANPRYFTEFKKRSSKTKTLFLSCIPESTIGKTISRI